MIRGNTVNSRSLPGNRITLWINYMYRISYYISILISQYPSQLDDVILIAA